MSSRISKVDEMGFKIGKIIGRGTYSTVFKAKNDKGERFACKIIKKRAAVKDLIEKFLPREIDIIRSIKHPNIIKIFQILESKEEIYMLMDYCSNGDLLEYIKEYGCFSEDKSKKYFRQIVDAVHYLHNKDIAHRDLKCENIFLMWNNHVKLGDFGFARKCSDEFGFKILSDTFCGSTAYAPPEILRGISYDPKAYDMWALGCILYIMVSGSMPFDDGNLGRMIKSQMSRSIFTITILWSEASDGLKAMLNSLLEPTVCQRINISAVKNHDWLKEGGALQGIKNKLQSISDMILS